MVEQLNFLQTQGGCVAWCIIASAERCRSLALKSA
jgi:hypothetical protein